MTDALQTSNLPPAAIALIKEGSPKPQTAIAVLTTPSSTNLQENPVSKPAAEPSASVVKTKPQKDKPLETTGLVSLNCRLPAEIPLALLKASSERKMKKVRPFTQQDIIAEALTDWLTKNKYMS
jgi:hypothetical protein